MVQYVHAEGPVGQHGVLQEGDEILEVYKNPHTPPFFPPTLSSLPPPPRPIFPPSFPLLFSSTLDQVNGTVLVGLHHNDAIEVVKDTPTHVTFVVCRSLVSKDTVEPHLTGACNEFHYGGH